MFTSGDESIATVDANGRITAVSEGKTVIYITCGDKQLTCPVTCQFEAETEPVHGGHRGGPDGSRPSRPSLWRRSLRWS